MRATGGGYELYSGLQYCCLTPQRRRSNVCSEDLRKKMAGYQTHKAFNR